MYKTMELLSNYLAIIIPQGYQDWSKLFYNKQYGKPSICTAGHLILVRAMGSLISQGLRGIWTY